MGKFKIILCQLGYRAHTSTLDAITVLKEVVSKYVTEGSTIYSSSIDMSKAFERVSHEKLFRKLENANVPEDIIYKLKYLFSNS